MNSKRDCWARMGQPWSGLCTGPFTNLPKDDRTWRPARDAPTSNHAVFGKPGEHAFPSVLRLFLAIAGTIIGIKCVACVRIDMDLRFLVLARCLEGGLQFVDGCLGNTLVF